MDEKTRDTEGEGNKELIFPRVGYNSVNQANYAVGDLARFCNALKDPYRNQTTLTSTTRDVLDKDIPKPPAWRLVSPKELVEVVVTGAKNVGDPNYIVLNGKACTLPPYVIEEDIMLDNMPGRFRGEPFFGRDEIAALYINLFQASTRGRPAENEVDNESWITRLGNNQSGHPGSNDGRCESFT